MRIRDRMEMDGGHFPSAYEGHTASGTIFSSLQL